MRFVSLTVSGYRQFVEPTTLAIPLGITGICGQNGVGKSKIIEAIGYALYGANRRILPRGDKITDLPSKAVLRSVPRAELHLELRGQVYEIVRSPKEAYIRLQGALDNLAETSFGVTSKVVELLRLTPGAFQATFVARQREVAGLQAITSSKERQSMVNRLIGISQVEMAIHFAQQTRINRESAWQEQVRNNKPTAAEASAIVEQERLIYAETAAEAARQMQKLEDARSQYTFASDELVLLNQRAAKVAILRETQRDLATLQTTLESTKLNARKRAIQAGEAAVELADAQRALADTADVPAQLAECEKLAKIAGLLQQRESLVDDLEERILNLVKQRTQLEAAIQADTTELERLGKEREKWTNTYSLVVQSANQAKAEAERHELRRQEAKRLGRAGECRTCGQVFGDRLEQALEHYATEVAEARRKEEDARDRAAEAKTRESDIQQVISALEEQSKLRRAGMRSYENIPGEETRTRRDLEEIASELASFSPEMLTQPYDQAGHNSLMAEMARREQAKADAARLTPLAAQEAEARAEEREADHRLQEIARREQNLRMEISQLEPTPELLAGAKEKEAQAKTAFEKAEQLAREMAGRVASTETRVGLAEAELARAEERERSIAEAHRLVFVAHRTQEVLTRLLAEITAEARPRLSELMDTWARALLGPRFRSIDLTEDYRIVADNGSGPHHIEHFSGGEQTLLSVMLRVAISLFCRERAGFDTGFLVLDEVFGDQDGDHRAQLVQFLEEIKPHYHQILVVNHVEDVTNMLDNVIDVIPTGPNASIANLRL